MIKDIDNTIRLFFFEIRLIDIFYFLSRRILRLRRMQKLHDLSLFHLQKKKNCFDFLHHNLRF